VGYPWVRLVQGVAAAPGGLSRVPPRVWGPPLGGPGGGGKKPPLEPRAVVGACDRVADLMHEHLSRFDPFEMRRHVDPSSRRVAVAATVIRALLRATHLPGRARSPAREQPLPHVEELAPCSCGVGRHERL